MDIVISCIEILWWLAVVPVAVGMLFSCIPGRRQEELSGCVTLGYVTVFGLFEVVSVPLILLQKPFHVLVWIIGILLTVLALVSLFWNRKRLPGWFLENAKGLVSQPWTVYAAMALIAVQVVVYVLFMAIDLDDSFYVAAASTALHTDAMYTYSAYGGYYLGYVPSRYGLSPFPMFLAFLCRCTQQNAAMMAHTVLPVFLVPFAYMVFFQLAKLLFRGDRKQSGMFLLLLAVINMSSYYSVYTQGTFLLIRIWQGKAVLAGALLPFLFLNCYRVLRADPQPGDWLLLLLNVTACCMVSSMGIALAPVMLAIFGVLFAMTEKRWKHLIATALCGLPCVVLGVCYLLMR